MKNKEIVSGVVGASFFALGYLGLSIAFIPALAIGAGAYAASELVIKGPETSVDKLEEKSLKKRIDEARKQNKHINEMIHEVDSVEVSSNIRNINLTAGKIINTIEKNKLNNKQSNKFLDYYLPVCVNIIDRYDEIENQSLTSRDSKEFMKNTGKLLKATNKAFRKILNSLYQSDIVDADAEMKVFNTMLTADGYDETILEDGEKDE